MISFFFLHEYTKDMPTYIEYGVHGMIYAHIILFILFLSLLIRDRLKPVKEEKEKDKPVTEQSIESDKKKQE